MIRRIHGAVAIAGLVLASAVVTPGAARAQAKFELTPFVGSFYPLAKMCTDCNKDGNNIRGQLLSSAVLGGRLTYWFSPTMGFEASGAYTPSRIQVSAADTTGFVFGASAKGNVLLMSGRLLYRPARTNLHFIIGGGIVHRGGNVWSTAHDSAGTKITSPAGILGIGVRAAVTPKFALNVSAEGNFYSFDPKLGPTGNESNGGKLQADFVVAVGVPIILSK
jgi:hypothetical protein